MLVAMVGLQAAEERGHMRKCVCVCVRERESTTTTTTTNDHDDDVLNVRESARQRMRDEQCNIRGMYVCTHRRGVREE